MLRKNVAAQVLTFCLVNATTGAPLTGASVTVVVALDGTQAAGAGTVTELGTGQYKYVPTQAETNGITVGFGFTASNAVPVNIHCFIAAFDPTDAVSLGLSRLDAAVSSRMATYTQPAGFLAATFPTGTVASTTNITAGTITTTTNLTNLPSIPANWITAAGINAGALNGKGDWNIGKTGYSISGTLTTLDALNSDLSSVHGAGSWATATGFSTHSAADVWASGTRTLTAGTNIVLAKGTGVTGFNDLDAAGVATAVWNAATATYGSAGSYGLLVESNLDATVSSVNTAVAGVQSDTDNIQTRLPAALVGGRMDANVASAGIEAAALLAIADALLKRDMSAVSGEASRSPLNALRLLRNKWDAAAGTLTVKKEDDTTTAWTGALSSDAAADPVIGVDPA
jgi:hypothetical protein